MLKTSKTVRTSLVSRPPLPRLKVSRWREADGSALTSAKMPVMILISGTLPGGWGRGWVGGSKNRHSCSQRVKQHQINGDIPLSLSQIFVSFLEDASSHTHSFKRGALLLFSFINNTSLFHILLCTILQIVSR